MVSAVNYRSLTLSRIDRLNNFSNALAQGRDRTSTYTMLHKEDREKISGQVELLQNLTIDWREISRQGLKGRIQKNIEGEKQKLRVIAFQEIQAGNWINHFQKLPLSSVEEGILPFLTSYERTDLQSAFIDCSTLEASRFQRLHQFSLGLERRKKFEVLDKMFLYLHKNDRAKISSFFHEWKVDIFNEKSLKQHRGSLQKIVWMVKSELAFTMPPIEKRVDHVKRVPSKILGTDIASFLTVPQELFAFQRVCKKTKLAQAPTQVFLKEYPRLIPFIKKYLHVDVNTLPMKEKNTAFVRFMSLVHDLGKLESLELPTYSTLGNFIQLIEARNLLRMIVKIDYQHGLTDFDPATIKITEKNGDFALQQAEAIRQCLEQHQEIFAGIDVLHLWTLEQYPLTLLPEEIGQFKALQGLYLNNNRIVALSESIGKLKALKKCNLSGNLLSDLPESFGQLKALEEFYVDFNRLVTLPKSFDQLQNLKILVLDKQCRKAS